MVKYEGCKTASLKYVCDYILTSCHENTITLSLNRAHYKIMKITVEKCK